MKTAARCGTKYSYGKGCRCDECRAANSAYQREYSRRPHVKAQRSEKERRRWAKMTLEQKRKRKRSYHRWAAKAKFGLTLEEYDSLRASPCLVCASPKSVPDHDHATGELRGPLCSVCNRALGLLGDDPIRVAAPASYIREWAGKFGRFAKVA